MTLALSIPRPNSQNYWNRGHNDFLVHRDMRHRPAHCGTWQDKAYLLGYNNQPLPTTPAWFVEITDTFNGDANYSWVRRYKVIAKSRRTVVSIVTRHYGPPNDFRLEYDDGNMSRHNVRGAAICMFIMPWDEYHANERIEATLPQ